MSQTKADWLYLELRNAILSGSLPPGERLQQTRLAAQYGTSQTPVREALRRLESELLVVRVGHKGAIVRAREKEPISSSAALAHRLREFACDPSAVPGSDFP